MLSAMECMWARPMRGSKHVTRSPLPSNTGWSFTPPRSAFVHLSKKAHFELEKPGEANSYSSS